MLAVREKKMKGSWLMKNRLAENKFVHIFFLCVHREGESSTVMFHKYLTSSTLKSVF